MRLEDFISMCERKAIKTFNSLEGILPSEIESKAKEIALELSNKREDSSYHYEIALPAIMNVFRNPSRFAGIKQQSEKKHDKSLAPLTGNALN